MVIFVTGALAPWPGNTLLADKPFTHPGILHSWAELDYVKAKVAEGEEPWKSAWEELRSHGISRLDWKPKPAANVVRGPYNRPDIGGTDLMRDAAAAYSHAIQWYVASEKPHADKAIDILDSYAITLKSVGGHDAKLLVGMVGINFVNAAEIIRHTQAGWSDDDQKQFEHLLRKVFYPIIKDFYPTANGNWDAAMIQTMLAMGVFLDDREMFQRAVDYYLDGDGNGAICKYINEFGECQESGRDQAHTQMGLGYLGCAAEIAWKQGVDLYGAYNNRLAVGFEYTAKYNLGHDVPYEPYRSHEGRYNYPGGQLHRTLRSLRSRPFGSVDRVCCIRIQLREILVRQRSYAPSSSKSRTASPPDTSPVTMAMIFSVSGSIMRYLACVWVLFASTRDCRRRPRGTGKGGNEGGKGDHPACTPNCTRTAIGWWSLMMSTVCTHARTASGF